MSWWYRPLTWPVWTHGHRRLVRFWSADGGLDAEVIDALRTLQFDRLAVVEPSTEALVEQLREELAVSRSHLRRILDRYWDEGWRETHKGCDESPEVHLWRAATAVAEMGDALDELAEPV